MRCAIAMMWACLLLAGCGQNAYLDANLELMNAERRALEDRLYELEYEYEAKTEELEEYRRENEGLKRRLDGGDSGRRAIGPNLDADADDEADLSVPRIEIPPLDRDAAAPGDPRPAAPVPVLTASGQHPKITQVEINRRLLRGVDFDERPGDDGLSIVVEPRSANGKLVPIPGPITVVVLDHALRGQGERARFAMWELGEDDVSRFLQDSPPGQGIRMHLLWPAEPPRHGKLQVHVRYHTADGRRLDSRRDVRIKLPPRLSQRWTPRAAESKDLVIPDGVVQDRRAGDSESAAEQAARPEWQPFR